MKRYWQWLEITVDARTLRERVVIFAMVVLIFVTFFNAAAIDPQYAAQKQLSEQLSLQRSQISAMQIELQEKIRLQAIDPDAANKLHLKELQQQAVQLRSTLLDTQKGLVSPDKMSMLLEEILKRNGHLQLVSLKTLPANPLGDASDMGKQPDGQDLAATLPKALQEKAKGSSQAVGAVYSHAVEMTVQGKYLDMMSYLAQLESLPSQLYWSDAKLEVSDYPDATLTVTLFTMSLDKQWLNI